MSKKTNDDNPESKMTDSDKMIYNYIVTYISQYMFSPSIRDICDAVGLSSTSSVHAHLNKLERLGFIERVCDDKMEYATRNIRLKGYKLVKHEEAK